jgi:hypothetical protein
MVESFFEARVNVDGTENTNVVTVEVIAILASVSNMSRAFFSKASFSKFFNI